VTRWRAFHIVTRVAGVDIAVCCFTWCRKGQVNYLQARYQSFERRHANGMSWQDLTMGNACGKDKQHLKNEYHMEYLWTHCVRGIPTIAEPQLQDENRASYSLINKLEHLSRYYVWNFVSTFYRFLEILVNRLNPTKTSRILNFFQACYLKI